MSTPPNGASRATAVREGLRRLTRDPASWPAPSTVILRNRLLDECGGEARPLVALLVQAAELGIPARLPAPGAPPAAWESARGALVVALVAEGFIQREMAVWAVEAWAYALGVIDDASLTGARSAASSSTPAGGPVPVPVGATRGGAMPQSPRTVPVPTTSHRPAVPTASAPRAVASARATPSWTPGPAAPPSPLLRWISAASVLVIIVGVAALLVWTARRASAVPDGQPIDRSSTPDAVAGPGERTAPSDAPLPPGPAPSPGPGAPAVTAASASIDSARLLRVTPPTRPPVLLERGSVPYVPNPSLIAPDRVLLREGRTIIGRVEVVRAASVLFRDGESGLRYEIDKRDIAEITTEFGTTVRFSGSGAPVNERAATPVVRGVGGRYDVRYAVAGIDGSPECRALWRTTPAQDLATVSHVPGADSLSIAFAGGGTFFAVIDREGRFATTFVVKPDQALTSTALTTRLNGRFGFTGFEATVTVLSYQRARYGRDVACQSRLSATGTLRAAALGR